MGDGKQSQEEFHTIMERLCEQYQPLGIIEENLVETIAICWLRKARVLRAENGEIRKRLDCARIDAILSSSDEFDLDILCVETRAFVGERLKSTEAEEKLSLRDKLASAQELYSRLQRSRRGLYYLMDILVSALAELSSTGHIPELLQKQLVGVFGSNPEFMQSMAACWDKPPAGINPAEIPEEKVNDPDYAVQAILRELRRLKALELPALVREKLAVEAEVRRLSLPPADATDKLLRYEAHIDRQLYRAMGQLERLQRQRKGEPVPPPLNVNLARRN